MSQEQTRKTTLCWECRNAVPSPKTGAGCPWSIAGKPVEGWTAERRDILFQRGAWPPACQESYLVTACPLFQSETPPADQRPQEPKDRAKQEGDTMTRKCYKDQVECGRSRIETLNATAKKVAELLAESAATMPEVEEIMEKAKDYLDVMVIIPDIRVREQPSEYQDKIWGPPDLRTAPKDKNEIALKINTEQVDEAMRKVNGLSEALVHAVSLADEVASKLAHITISF